MAVEVQAVLLELRVAVLRLGHQHRDLGARQAPVAVRVALPRRAQARTQVPIFLYSP